MHPSKQVGRLAAVLVASAALAACGGDDDSPPQADAAVGISTGATSPSPDATATASDLEARVIASLKLVGVGGGVTEHGIKEAWVGGPWNDRFVQLHVRRLADSSPSPDAGTDSDTPSTIAGQKVTFVATTAFGPMATFECDGLRYEVGALTADQKPESSSRASTTAFLKKYIPSLNCT